MHAYDPRDWHRPADNRPAGPDRDQLIRWGLVVALCFFLASLAPRAMVPAVFSGLLFLAAVGSAVTTALCREPIDPPRLTIWDEAAVCLALSLLVKLLFPVQPLMQSAMSGP